MKPANQTFSSLRPGFPRSVLPHITSLLCSYDIARLWLCGDQRLAANLENGGVACFRHIADTFHPARFPVLISRFSGVKDVLIDYTAYNKLFSPRIRWPLFPEGLETLDFRLATSKHHILLRDNHTSAEDTFDPEDVLYPGEKVTIDATALQHLRQLRTLKGSFVCGTSLENLPHTLLNLEYLHVMSLPSLEQATLFIGSVPERLTSLGIYLDPNFAFWRQLFLAIPSIEKLHMRATELAFEKVTLADWKALPRSLLDLVWNTPICNSKEMVLHPLIYSFMPGYNSHVEDDRIRESCEKNLFELIDSLPPNLTYLEVSHFKGHEAIYSRLPKNMREFKGGPGHKAGVQFPPSLTALHPNDAQIQHASNLPPSLTDLFLLGTDTSVDVWAQLTELKTKGNLDPSLSDGLLTAQIYEKQHNEMIPSMQVLQTLPLRKLSIEANAFPLAELGRLLPRTLTEFDAIEAYMRNTPASTSMSGSRLETLFGSAEDAHPRLPLLKSISIRPGLLDQYAVRSLPRTLTEIDFGQFSNALELPPSDELWSTWLPQGLKRWYAYLLPCYDLIKSVEGGNWHIDSLTWQHVSPSWYAHLPASLTYFNAKTTHFGAAHMQTLAEACTALRNLKLVIFSAIVMNRIEDLTDRLPPSLTHFKLFLTSRSRRSPIKDDPNAHQERDDQVSNEDGKRDERNDKELLITAEAFRRLPRGLNRLKLMGESGVIKVITPLPVDAPRFLIFQCGSDILRSSSPSP